MNTTAVDKSLEIYTQAQQVHNLKHRALLVAQALEPLKDEESIKKIAEFEDTYLRGRFRGERKNAWEGGNSCRIFSAN